ncbi:hemolysin III family protein [uncultured Tateyamaria sp.]|uniref:PAQR family membrane homeostasis protein TrhA n=1 Tax=uncultured Tateyamaria sp. TaxID=455651 RepID=UPI00260C1920|nr:hemolysin III family protein [uncultured Tateyamaria sp.]
MPYPHSVRETLADASVHVLGLTAGITASAMLLVHVMQTQGAAQIAATSIYTGLAVFALVASASYHLLRWERSRPVFHRIDHAAICLKIAGTYTPLVVLIGSAFAYVVLAAVWLVALLGALAKLSFWATDARGSLALYLAMGWASVLLIWPMWQNLPGASTALIVAGGGLYSLGTVFYAQKSLRFQNAIWHSFVLAASACFFGAVALGLSV